MSEEKNEQMQTASNTLAIMLDYLGLEAAIKPEEKEDKIRLVIHSENDAGRIIGKRGQTLSNLQLLVNRMLNKGTNKFPYIFIDLEGYGKRKNPREKKSVSDTNDKSKKEFSKIDEGVLEQQALDAAKEVKRWGETVSLPPMNSKERRIIHMTLKEDGEIKTESGGDGRLKKVLVALADKAE